MKRPSFQFYPGDWLNDLGLRACSSAARGLWIDLICYMHQGDPYGYLTIPKTDKDNHEGYPSAPLDNQTIARLSGLNSRSIPVLLRELERNKVVSKTESGILYSRRMVRDEQLRKVRANGGVKSLEHPNVPKPKGYLKDGGKGYAASSPPPLSLRPSPSSSSSSSKDLTPPSPPFQGGVISFQSQELKNQPRRCLMPECQGQARTGLPGHAALFCSEACYESAQQADPVNFPPQKGNLP